MPIFRKDSILRKNYKNINKDFSSLNPSDINKLDQYGNTVLHLAAKEGNIKLVSDLISLGIDTQIINHKHQTALDIVNRKILQNNKMHNEYSEIAQQLIDHHNLNNTLLKVPTEFIETKTTIIAINHKANTHSVVNKDKIIDDAHKSIQKIQQLTESNNVSQTQKDEAHKICSKALEKILSHSENVEKQIIDTNAINSGIAKNAVNNHIQQNSETESSINQVRSLAKIKPQLPPKPKNLLSPKTLADVTQLSASEEQSNHDAALSELDDLLALCEDFLIDNNVDLIG